MSLWRWEGSSVAGLAERDYEQLKILQGLRDSDPVLLRTDWASRRTEEKWQSCQLEKCLKQSSGNLSCSQGSLNSKGIKTPPF